MEFRKFCKDDILQASKLLSDRHKRERKIFPALKAEFEDFENTKNVLDAQFEKEYTIGVCACDGDKLSGFILSHIENDPTFGRRAFVCYEEMAIAEGESPELYRKLYCEISKLWLMHGALYHQVMVPAGYREVVDSWLNLSFAFQQVLGMTALTKSDVNVPDGITVKQADESDSQALINVSHLILPYQAGSPAYGTLLPERMTRIKNAYGELPTDDDCTVFLAYRGDKLLGFQCAEKTEDELDMLIPEKSFDLCVCATVEDSRGSGVATMLTKRTFNWAIEQGYENAVADWRIANLYSSVFWPKRGFKPYAYRMARRIDERVYWATGKNLLDE